MANSKDDIEILRVHLLKLQKAITRVLARLDGAKLKRREDPIELPPDYVACVEISRVIRAVLKRSDKLKRSDSIARKDSESGFPVIKRAAGTTSIPRWLRSFYPEWRNHVRKTQ
jgi:hypothetical protein